MLHTETQITLLAPALFSILFGLIVLNLLIYLAYLISKPSKITKQMCNFWTVQLSIFLLVPIFDHGNLQNAIPFSFNFITIYIAYKALFSNLTEMPSYKNFVYIFILGWIFAFINEVIYHNFTYTTLPIATAIAIPPLYLIYKVFLGKNNNIKSIHHKLFTIMLFGSVVHIFNFSFFRNDPSNFLWGMIVHILLVSAFSITLSNFHIFLLEKNEKKRLSELVDLKTKELSTKYQELQTITEEKAKLFRVVIHDLSNPITSLINYLSLLKRPNLDQEKREGMVEQAYEISTGIINTIKQVRDMEGLKTGKLNIKNELINLAETFNIVDLIFRNQYDKKGVILKIDYPSEEIFFQGNKDLFIHTVLSNLLSNSLKFTLPGSVVNLSYKIKNDKLQIFVTDEGRGIHRERLSSLFSMDTVTSSTGTHGESGTGFGMPLVKNYIDKVDGSIEIKSRCKEENQHNHGTEIELSFNLSKVNPSPEQPSI